MRAARQEEQELDGAGIDAPGLLRDVTRLAAPAVRTLCLGVLGAEVDEALGAERRRESVQVQMREVVGERSKSLSARVALPYDAGEEQDRRRNHHAHKRAETSKPRSHRQNPPLGETAVLE